MAAAAGAAARAAPVRAFNRDSTVGEIVAHKLPDLRNVFSDDRYANMTLDTYDLTDAADRNDFFRVTGPDRTEAKAAINEQLRALHPASASDGSAMAAAVAEALGKLDVKLDETKAEVRASMAGGSESMRFSDMGKDSKALNRFLGDATVWTSAQLEFSTTAESHHASPSIGGHGAAWAAEFRRVHEAQLKVKAAGGKARKEAYEPLLRRLVLAAHAGVGASDDEFFPTPEPEEFPTDSDSAELSRSRSGAGAKRGKKIIISFTYGSSGLAEGQVGGNSDLICTTAKQLRVLCNVELKDPTRELLRAFGEVAPSLSSTLTTTAANLLRSVMAQLDGCAGWQRGQCFDAPQFGLLTDFFVTVFVKLERHERDGWDSGANHFSFRLYMCDPKDGGGLEGLVALMRAMFTDATAAAACTNELPLRKRPRAHPSVQRHLPDDDGGRMLAVPPTIAEAWDGERAAGGEGGGGFIPSDSMEAHKAAMIAAHQGRRFVAIATRQRVYAHK